MPTGTSRGDPPPLGRRRVRRAGRAVTGLEVGRPVRLPMRGGDIPGVHDPIPVPGDDPLRDFGVPESGIPPCQGLQNVPAVCINPVLFAAQGGQTVEPGQEPDANAIGGVRHRNQLLLILGDGGPTPTCAGSCGCANPARGRQPHRWILLPRGTGSRYMSRARRIRPARIQVRRGLTRPGHQATRGRVRRWVRSSPLVGQSSAWAAEPPQPRSWP